MTEVWVLQGDGCMYAVHLHIDSREELRRVADALKPLGYRFRKPKR